MGMLTVHTSIMKLKMGMLTVRRRSSGKSKVPVQTIVHYADLLEGIAGEQAEALQHLFGDDVSTVITVVR